MILPILERPSYMYFGRWRSVDIKDKEHLSQYYEYLYTCCRVPAGCSVRPKVLGWYVEYL